MIEKSVLKSSCTLLGIRALLSAAIENELINDLENLQTIAIDAIKVFDTYTGDSVETIKCIADLQPLVDELKTFIQYKKSI